MLDLRRFGSAAGEGALLGAVVGAARGAREVAANDDIAHRMFWLAADRLVPSALGWSAAAALGAVAVAAILAAAGRPGSKGARLAAAIGTAAALALAALLIGPWRLALISDPASTSLPAALLSGGAQIAAGLLLVAARVVDAWRASAGSGPRRWSAAAGWAALVVLTAVHVAMPVAATARVSDRPSVILVSLDTLRADRLGVLGGPEDLMPNLDAFARDALLFEQAQSASPWTLPSHASLFTGRLPFDHGARWSFSRIAPSRALLAEHLRNAGYRTAAVNGNAYVGKSFGFAQGFEIYDERDEELNRGVDGIVDDSLAWVAANGDRPFFLFVHTYEPHVPYIGLDRANPDDRGRLPETFTSDILAQVHAGTLVLDERERRYVRSLYDGDAARTDRAFGRLIDGLRAANVLERSIVVVFSDHGEALWDRPGDRSPGHGHSLARELVHVPLIVRGPGLVRSARVGTPVSLIDVAPTLLDLLRLPVDRDQHGRSLTRTWLTGEAPEAVPVLSESVEYGPDRFAVFADGYKAVVVPMPDVAHGGVLLQTTPLEVYDLSADPGEKHDLGARPPAASARAVALAYERARTKLRKSEAYLPADTSSEELQRTLRSLGYIQ